MRSVATGFVAIVILAVAVSFCAASDEDPAPAAPSAGEEQTTMPYGFRRDPMTFARNDATLQGALVRTFVLEQPKEGDAALIQARIDEILAEQREDGSLADNAKDTGSKLLELLKLGCPRDRPEVQRAAEAIVQQARTTPATGEEFEKDASLAVYPMEALCRLDRRDVPEVAKALTWYVQHSDQWNDPWKGCPWTPEVFWTALWAGREYMDTVPTIEAGMSRVLTSMNAAGCSAYNDPYGFVDACGQIALPEARALVEKQIPLILRGQQPDGGWGDNSLAVFRALKVHGFLDELRGRDSLPPDWTIVRSLPAPAGDLRSLAWDGEHLWVYDRAGKAAVCLSPDDGSVVRKLDLPFENVYGIGWWDGALAVTQTDPKKLLCVDPATGEIRSEIVIDKTDWTWVGAANQVDGKVWVADTFSPGIIVIDPADPDTRSFRVLAGPGPAYFAPTPDGVWHSDFWANLLIKTAPDGTLLAWGDRVFDHPPAGLAFDGRRLWALDASKARICTIEKAAP